MSVDASINMLYLVNFILGYSLASGLILVSFYCMVTYPDMGAIASGIGVCGFALSASVWAICASSIVNPLSIDPVDGFYTLEISQNVTLLFKYAFLYSIIMAGLCIFLLKDPVHLKRIDISTIISFDTTMISKITLANRKTIEESFHNYYESLYLSVNLTNINKKENSMTSYFKFETSEKAETNIVDPLGSKNILELKSRKDRTESLNLSDCNN